MCPALHLINPKFTISLVFHSQDILNKFMGLVWLLEHLV